MKKKLNITIEQVEALLPQTQCGLCGYPACRPYAEAIINGERIDRCPPGGAKTLLSLAQLTSQEATSNMVLNMGKNVRPERVALIREEACIGCTKCLQACPVDAIIGATKLMHTVINDACTGCELCVTPCPVDCIDMVEIAKRDDEQQSIFANQSRHRYQRHLKKEQIEKINEQPETPNIAVRQAEIAAAIARVKARNQKHESTNTS